MLLDLPHVCQLKILRFLNEKSLIKTQRSSKRLQSVVEKNRSRLCQKNYRFLATVLQMLGQNPSVIEFDLVFGKYEYSNEGEMRNYGKTLHVFHHHFYNKKAVLPEELTDYKLIAEIASHADGGSAAIKRHQKIEVDTENVIYCLKERMRKEFQNSHIIDLIIWVTDFCPQAVERLASILTIHKLSITTMTLSNCDFDHDAMKLFSRLLRDVDVPYLRIMGGLATARAYNHKEFIELIPTMQGINLNLFNEGDYKIEDYEYEEYPVEEVNLPMVAPKTILPPTMSISLDNFRKIIQDWYYGRRSLLHLQVSTSDERIPTNPFDLALGIPYNIIHSDHSNMPHIIIDGPAGEQCIIVEKGVLVGRSRWCVNVLSYNPYLDKSFF